MSIPRTAAYRAAISALADAVADIPITKLAPVFLMNEVFYDLDAALERRHRRFAKALSDASDAHYRQQRIERRRAGARKAAVTRAERVKARTSTIEAEV
ncbi:hypothetical protein AB7M49_006097 [Bradyrhizobium elkanii]